MNKLISLLLVGLVIFSSNLLFAFAENPVKEKNVVRVAFPLQSGLTDFDEYGNYSGYTYEYLEEIAQYTGWDYEFVQVPGTVDQSLFTLMDMLQKGEVDLMGGMLYNEQMGQLFNYSSNSYGTSDTVLQVLYDDTVVTAINSQIKQEYRIAVLSSASRLLEELEDYCAMNLITPIYVKCGDEQEQLQALRDGRADMLLNSSSNPISGVRTVARFAPKPFYFITGKGNESGLMEELNEALVNIQQVDPAFSSALYDKYFSPMMDTFHLSQKEEAYIQSAGVLKAGYLDSSPPFQYVKGLGEEPQGISVALLAYISEKAGLRFELVRMNTQEELYQAAAQGDIQILVGLTYDYHQARERGISMSRPYISSQYVILMNENANEDTLRGKRLALPQTSTYKGGYFLGQVTYYDTTDECIKAVEDGRADYTYVDAYTAQYFINQPEFTNLKMIPQTYEPRRVCLGIAKPVNHELLSILNKVIVTIPLEDMQAMVYNNTVQPPNFTLNYFIRQNPIAALGVTAFGLLVIIACLLTLLYQRIKTNKNTSLELKKHYRVYAMLSEYFFEYSYKENTLLVSLPKRDRHGHPTLMTYDYDQPASDEEENQLRETFLQFVCSRQDGVNELCISCLDGREHWLRIGLETVYDGDEPAYVLGKINLIDEEKREKDALLAKAQLDSLTRIYNAEASRERICENLMSLPEGANGALLLIDIDNFKMINDTYGHLQGDFALTSLAQLLKKSFRGEDIVGRPGGDEFVVYMKTVKDIHSLENKCASLCADVNQILLLDTALTVSVGTALSYKGDSFDSLYAAADQALYKAKRSGRNQFCIAQSPKTGVKE